MTPTGFRRSRAGLLLMPMIGLLVLIALLSSMLARKHVRGHRAFQTLARQSLARQIAIGETERIRRVVDLGEPVSTGSRVLSPADVPGMPETVAIEVTGSQGTNSKYRVEVRIPAEAGPNVVKESLEIP